MAKQTIISTRRQPTRRQLSLRIEPVQMAQLKTHIAAVEQYTQTPAIYKVIELWPTLPDEVRAEVLEKSPTFARLVAIAERIIR